VKDGPNIARVAGLIGDPARAEILTALLAGRALTATELAAVAGVTKQTVSAHLAKLVDARLLAVEAQGRHRYFRLAGGDVARLLESLMGVAFRTGAVRLVTGPREPALRKARVCYDHLAGELGVALTDSLERQHLIETGDGSFALTAAGERRLEGLGIGVGPLRQERRAFTRPCLDWTERRPHLAGAVGAAIAEHALAEQWVTRVPGTRALRVTDVGRRGFLEQFALNLA
jgi:DNA-binding transcriptional ArsR family regulator